MQRKLVKCLAYEKVILLEYQLDWLEKIYIKSQILDHFGFFAPVSTTQLLSFLAILPSKILRCSIKYYRLPNVCQFGF